jgi:cation transport ATPase
MLSAKKKTKPSESLTSKVTQAELDALGATQNPLLHGGVDRYFKWRHAFLSVMVVVFSIRLLFFHDQVLNLSVIFNNLGIDTQKYLGFRSLYLITGAILYVVSYVRNWFFPQIAMVAFALALGGLVTDTLNFFAFYQGAFPQGVVFVVFLRSSVVVCMFYNAIYAHRAPPMPRHFWS